MKSELERLGACKVALKIEVPADGVTEEREKVYQELKKKSKIKGFRKGRVPREILEVHFSKGVEREVLERLISDAYRQAISQASIIPCSEPQIEGMEVAPEKPLKFKATVEVRPQVNLGKYKDIKVPKKVRTVKARDIDKALERLRHRHAEFVTIEDRPARKGDYAIVDFEGMIEEKPFPGGKASNYSLEIGSNTFIHGFEDQLIGMNRGDQREIRVRLPKEHPAIEMTKAFQSSEQSERRKELAGKEACFKVVLKEIKAKRLPPLDDEFAKDLGGFKTLAELREKISQDLERFAQSKAQRDWENKVLDKLIENTPLDVPQIMVAREIDHLTAGVKERLRFHRELAIRNVKSFLILEQIAEVENIRATPEDVATRIARVARYTNQPPQSIEESLKRSGGMDGFRHQIRQAKALKFVLG